MPVRWPTQVDVAVPDGSVFEVGGIRCLGPDRNGTWRYLPDRPGVRRAADGQPQTSWVERDGVAHLLFTATWAARPAALEALRARIATLGVDPGRRQARIAFATLADPVCRVLTGDGAGGWRTLAKSATSRTAPYDAVFDLTLRGSARAAALDARQGRSGRFAIEYAAVLSVPVRATGSFLAPGRRLRDHVDAHPATDLVDALDRAVQDGVADVRIESSDGDAGPVAAQLYARLLREVAGTVSGRDPEPPGDVAVTLELELERQHPVRAFADLAMTPVAQPAPVPPGGQHAADR